MGEILADLSDGWTTLVDVGSGVEVAWYALDDVGIRHTCDRGEKRGTIICAPRLVLNEPNGHTIVSSNPVTVSPSVGCDDCGLHGFIRNGRWEPC
jgi:hypothetical protein